MTKNNNNLEGCFTSIGGAAIGIGMLVYISWIIPLVMNNVYFHSIIPMFPQAPKLSFWNFLEIYFFFRCFFIFKDIKSIVIQDEKDRDKDESFLNKRRVRLTLFQLITPWLFLTIYHITLYFIK